MLRTIGAVVLGYIVMVVAVMSTFSLAYRAMGADRAYLPGSYDVSTLWLAVSIVLSFVAALIGGRVAARVGGTRAVRGLVGVVVVLGLATAIWSMIANEPDPGPRTENVSTMQAMTQSQTPAWIEWANIVIGAAGTLIGGRRPTTVA